MRNGRLPNEIRPALAANRFCEVESRKLLPMNECNPAEHGLTPLLHRKKWATVRRQAPPQINVAYSRY